MTALTHRAADVWAAGHRLLLAAVAVALAVAVAVTVVLLSVGGPAPASTTVGHLPVIDDGCAQARPYTPC